MNHRDTFFRRETGRFALSKQKTVIKYQQALSCLFKDSYSVLLKKYWGKNTEGVIMKHV